MMKNRSKLALVVLAAGATLALFIAACGDADGPSGGDDEAEEAANAIQPLGSEREADSGGDALGVTSSFGSAGQPAPAATSGASDPQSGSAQSTVDRKITRNASLELSVENVLNSVSQVEDIATTSGGFVSNSSLAVTSAEDGEDIETATVKIRVPAVAYTEVLRQLRGIAREVRSQSEDTQEVTEEYTDLQSRLRNLEATEQRYLDLLTRATTIPDILTLEDRLGSVRGQIEQVQGRINVLDDLTELATISIRLVLPAVITPSEEESQGWATEAWEKSWDASQDVLVVVGSIAIATVVFLPWFVVPTVIALAAWRVFGRRITDLADKVSGQGPTTG